MLSAAVLIGVFRFNYEFGIRVVKNVAESLFKNQQFEQHQQEVSFGIWQLCLPRPTCQNVLRCEILFFTFYNLLLSAGSDQTVQLCSLVGTSKVCTHMYIGCLYQGIIPRINKMFLNFKILCQYGKQKNLHVSMLIKTS